MLDEKIEDVFRVCREKIIRSCRGTGRHKVGESEGTGNAWWKDKVREAGKQMEAYDI